MVTRREPAALESAGLVLGHRVYVVVVGSNEAHRGRVAGLDEDVEVRLDRVRDSGAFRVGDRVRAMHPGRHAVWCVVVGSANGRLHLNVLLQ